MSGHYVHPKAEGCPNKFYDASYKGWVCPCLTPEEWQLFLQEKTQRELRAKV